MAGRRAWEVYGKTCGVSIGFWVGVACSEFLLRHAVHDRVLRWATAFALVQIIAVALQCLLLFSLRLYGQIKNSIYDQIRPAIRDRVMALAFEGETWASGVPEHGPARHVLEESIERALVSLKPPGRDRIARFAVDRGFGERWVKAYSSSSKRERKRAVSLLGLISPVAGRTILPQALEDEDRGVRIEAYRALLTLGAPADVERVFRAVLNESLSMRCLLADELKRHARFLLAKTIPMLLENGERFEIARCFEILIAWRRALPGFDVGRWLAPDSDRSLWPLVFALLPYVAVEDWIEEHLAAALESGNPELECAAAEATGRLAIKRLIPHLSAALGRGKEVGLASARAIAQMGEAGERHLEKIAAGSDRRAAAIAMEALEQVTVRV